MINNPRVRIFLKSIPPQRFLIHINHRPLISQNRTNHYQRRPRQNPLPTNLGGTSYTSPIITLLSMTRSENTANPSLSMNPGRDEVLLVPLCRRSRRERSEHPSPEVQGRNALQIIGVLSPL